MNATRWKMPTQINPRSNPYTRTLFYGRPGSTKTRTACTAALDSRTSPCLLLNAGGNPLSIRDYDPQPTIIEMEQLEDLNAPYDWLRKGQPVSHPFVKQFDLTPPYKSVIIDQITQVQRMMFAKTMGYDDTARYGPGTLVPKREWEHYNKVLYSMINMASLYVSLPIHVILVAQESNKPIEEGVVGVALEGQGAIEVPSYVYVIGRLVHRGRMKTGLVTRMEEASGVEVVSVCFFASAGGYDAKDQYGALGDYMINPTLTQMLDLIYGKE